MKRTKTMYAVIEPNAKILYDSFGKIGRYARDNAEIITGVCWKGLYAQGYRCRKVKIQWEE